MEGAKKKNKNNKNKIQNIYSGHLLLLNLTWFSVNTHFLFVKRSLWSTKNDFFYFAVEQIIFAHNSSWMAALGHRSWHLVKCGKQLLKFCPWRKLSLMPLFTSSFAFWGYLIINLLLIYPHIRIVVHVFGPICFIAITSHFTPQCTIFLFTANLKCFMWPSSVNHDLPDLPTLLKMFRSNLRLQYHIIYELHVHQTSTDCHSHSQFWNYRAQTKN